MSRHSRNSLIGLSLLLVVAGGCESLQRKFTRKPKILKSLSPIIQFQDYTQAMTPLDKYRKHAMLYDYWNSNLLETLQDSSFNRKRAKHASAESLLELKTLQGLLDEELAGKMAPLVAERERVNQEIQSGAVAPNQADGVVRRLETHTRALHRDFYWRDVQDRLQGAAAEADAVKADTAKAEP